MDSKNDKLRMFLRLGGVFCLRHGDCNSHFNHVGPGRDRSKTINLSITRTKTVNNSSDGKKKVFFKESCRSGDNVDRRDLYRSIGPEFGFYLSSWNREQTPLSSGSTSEETLLKPGSLMEPLNARLFLRTLPRVLCSSGLWRYCLAVRGPESGSFNELWPASNVGFFPFSSVKYWSSVSSLAGGAGGANCYEVCFTLSANKAK